MEIIRFLLTASGGPFRGMSREELSLRMSSRGHAFETS